MSERSYNLAIETSGRTGSVTLGCGDQRLSSHVLSAKRRHDVGLMPSIDAICRDHGIGPTDLAEIYVSIGPGSFTGLRVSITTVKMLALSLGVRVVAVPSLDALAQNTPTAYDHAAVCLNLKRQTVYCGVYERQGSLIVPVSEPALRTLPELLADCPRPAALLGDPLPEFEPSLNEGVTVLSAELAVARSDAVWQLGRAMAKRGEFADPMTLVPLYVRRPEAVELWDKRHGPAATA